MQRSLLIFLNSLKSKETQERYLYLIDSFIQYFKLKDYDGLASMDPKQLQVMIEDYIMDLKKRVNPNSVPAYVNPIQTFCEQNEININWKKVRKLFPEKIKASGRNAWTTEQIQRMLIKSSDFRTRALIHFLASTGCRIGSLPDLKMKHLISVDFGCKAVLVYADTKDEYHSFLTSEASKALNDYIEIRQNDGEHITKESPLFRRKYILGMSNVRPMSKKSMIAVISRILHTTGLRTNKQNGRYDTQAEHGFRKRFNTIMKLTPGIRLSLAEKLMGHSVTIPLDESYLNPTLNILFEEYRKAIKELTIDPTERQKVRIEESQKKIDEFEKSKLKNLDLEQKIKDIAFEHQEMKERLDKIDREDFLVREMAKLDEQMKKAMSENNDEWCQLYSKREELFKEYSEILS